MIAAFMSHIMTLELDCGLTLVAEPMTSGGVASAALNWLLPVGAATDPPQADGYAALLNEMLLRGAGDRDARQHSDALDRLGVQRSVDVQTHHMRIDAVMLGQRLHDALPLITDMVQAPAFPAEAL